MARVSRPALLGLCLFALFLALGCRERADWVMFRGEQGRGSTPNSLYPPLALKWKLQLQVTNEPARAFNPPIVLDDTIYFGSTDGNFYALDAASGFMHWVFKSKGEINSVPFGDKEQIYFGSNDGRVYAISRKTGEQIWEFDTGHLVQSTITRYKDNIIFTSDYGNSFFLSPEGQLKYVLPNPVWMYHTFQVYADVMYFAPGPLEQPHSFGAFDINRQTYLWILDTSTMDGLWYSFPALEGNTLHYATCDFSEYGFSFNYYALQRETGEILWLNNAESDFGEGIDISPVTLFYMNLELLDYMAPALWRDLVIYTSGDAVVRAFNTRTGELAWQKQFDYPTSSAPTVAGDRVYFGVRGDIPLPGEPQALSSSRAVTTGGRIPRLVCLAAETGKLLWEMELDGAILSAPVIGGKWLVFGTEANYFYVLEEVF
jgi:outer membrane protein assembly factor BamB